MARPLRIEFPGAVYHVTARGDRREPIVEDDADRDVFLHTLAAVVERFNWVCLAYCLMDNHYHLVVKTPDGNLSKGMRQLNGVFTQASNRRHRRSGHLFQGRFKAILVDADAYLLELARYVVLNPVRAHIVDDPAEWPWSSYRASAGEVAVPKWLAVNRLLRRFAHRRSDARQRYCQFVAEGIGQTSIWNSLRQQIYLGDERFVERMQRHIADADEINVPRAQRRPPAPSLATLATTHPERNAAIVAAYATGAYSYRQIGAFFGLHLVTVGRIVREATDVKASGRP